VKRALRTVEDYRPMVEGYLQRERLAWEPDGDDGWYVRMDGEQKKGISLVVRVRERTVRVESYFVRAPEEDRRALAYRWLLQRNWRQYIGFSCDEEGAIHLTGQVPLECFDEDELDRIIGSVREYQDDHWMDFLQMAFPKTLEAVRQGKPVPEE
jgi:hypothetical protein